MLQRNFKNMFRVDYLSMALTYLEYGIKTERRGTWVLDFYSSDSNRYFPEDVPGQHSGFSELKDGD